MFSLNQKKRKLWTILLKNIVIEGVFKNNKDNTTIHFMAISWLIEEITSCICWKNYEPSKSDSVWYERSVSQWRNDSVGSGARSTRFPIKPAIIVQTWNLKEKPNLWQKKTNLKFLFSERTCWAELANKFNKPFFIVSDFKSTNWEPITMFIYQAILFLLSIFYTPFDN
jgi:hypothetical protein